MDFRLPALFVLALWTSSSWAYVPTVTPGGAPIRWGGDTRLSLAGNPSNRSGIDAQQFFNAVVRGLQRWNSASGDVIHFDYWQGTDSSTYLPNSEYNGLSSIYFASNSGSPPSSNVLGLTQVWYDTSNGRILETDIILNDLNYHFTNNPQDTSGYGAPGSGWGDGKTVFIENVITHELGHAYGLSHSGGLQSTMLFMESPEQAWLGCDEQVGIRSMYPWAESGMRGAISGTVVSPVGAPVFGAHVLAISRARGTVLAAGITGPGGDYVISALEPGTYYLMAEPYFAGSSALPAWFGGINTSICSGERFSRTFLLESNRNRPKPVSVGAGENSQVQTLTVECSGNGSVALAEEAATASISQAPPLFDGPPNAGSGGFSAAARFGSSGATYYKLTGVSGRLEVNAMAYSLYSPINPAVTLLNSSGAVVSTTRLENVYSGSSGYVNYDSSFVAPNLPLGTYYIRITTGYLNAAMYPAGSLALDAAPFYMLIGSVNETAPPLAAAHALNARCKMDENFAAYSSPPGPPRRINLAIQQEEEESGGFCGTTSRGVGGPPNRGGGMIAGWLLPWVLMLMIARAGRRLELRLPVGRATL